MKRTTSERSSIQWGNHRCSNDLRSLWAHARTYHAVQKAAQVWDERIGSARVQAKNWRLMAFGCLMLSPVLQSDLSGNRREGRSRPGWSKSIVSQAQGSPRPITD